MVIPLTALVALLIHQRSSRVAALGLTVLSDPVALGKAAEFQWNAVASDPDQFILDVRKDGTGPGPFTTITRAGNLQGSGTTPALTLTGPHHLSALLSNDDSVATIAFQVSRIGKDLSLDKIVTGTSSSPAEVSPTSAPNRITGASSQSPSTGTSSQTQSAGASSPTKSTGTSSQTKVTQSLPGTSSNPSSSFVGVNSSTSSPSPASSRSHNTTIIIGTIVGVLLLVALFTGALLVWCRRRRQLRALSSQYNESATVEPWDGIAPPELTLNGGYDPDMGSEKLVRLEWTERRTSFQTQAQGSEKEVTVPESSPRNGSPELVRALMTETIRQNAEIQRLRELISSDWELGLTQIPPPSYPHSEAGSE
ncbi:hypothetical protein C8J56DRAFT_946184 [Mycena floridula]|nr:hypothetical protein C8J56DRAFT_946184 [Mycena floridula]